MSHKDLIHRFYDLMGVYASNQQTKDTTKETELVEMYNKLPLDEQIDAMIIVLEIIAERRTELSAKQLSDLEYENKRSQIALKNKIVLWAFAFALGMTAVFLVSPVLFRVVLNGNGSMIDRLSDFVKLLL